MTLRQQIDNQIVVEIEYFGKGIPIDKQKDVWEIGFSTKQQSIFNEIKGVGLYIVKSLCIKNNISIALESPVINEQSRIEHFGTKFTLIFIKNNAKNI